MSVVASIPVRRCPRCDGDFIPATPSTTVCLPCDNPAAARQAAYEARMAKILRRQAEMEQRL